MAVGLVQGVCTLVPHEGAKEATIKRYDQRGRKRLDKACWSEQFYGWRWYYLDGIYDDLCKRLEKVGLTSISLIKL